MKYVFFPSFIFCVITRVSSQTVNTCSPNTLNNTLAPDADDCNIYHICYDGEYAGNTRSCGITGQNFDVLKLDCAANAVCFKDYEPDCDTISGRNRLPSKESCRQYYDCTNGGELKMCSASTPYFDLKTSSCQADSISVICYPMSSKTMEPGLPNTCQPNIDYTDPLPHPSPAECGLYVKCEKGEVVSNGVCANGWNFDYIFLSCSAFGTCFPGESISCDFPNSDQPFVPHPKYCMQYYDCNAATTEERAVGVTCQEPTPYFDYRVLQCGAMEKVMCYPGSSRDTPPPT